MTATLQNIQTVAPYVLTTDKYGRYATIATVLTDQDAARIIASNRDTFSHDLVAAYRRNELTNNRRVWLHIKAMEALPTTQNASPVSKNLSGIAELFATAKAGAASRNNKGTRLKVRLSIDGQGISIKFASANGRNVGFLYVTDGGDFENGTYFGKISPTGDFLPSRDCTEAVKKLLADFNANPVQFARDFGKRTSQCCFCGRMLTDDKAGRSVEVGYGPICADLYGLPWG